ncbi:hypothetical protein [Nannocystis pusilla]|uniref:Uncharacterized protein n=1 Tax=Nannocystis pusilla TaxID=889268 RepID=A0ABS7TUL1_9BACT|nr:hypothetical protein [Nannocystis pusilla]MBZ5711929.1 hypothetical protein [Nannocystis pusilla]
MSRGKIGSLWSISVLTLWLAGCGNAGDDECTPGAEGCACAQGTQCLGGLSCFSNICVQSPSSPTTNDPSNPPTTSDGSSSTGDNPGPTTGTTPGCPQGLTQCEDGCADLAGDAAHCGGCGNACATGEVCQDSECVVVENCTPMSCPGLSYCSLDTKQCVPGCQFSDQCPIKEVCDTVTHKCVCGEGYHLKDGICQPCKEAAACGNSCTVCPAVANGSPACIDGKCGATCDDGYQECGGQCFVDYPPICGENRDNCTPCEEPEGGTVTCEGSKCTNVCPPGTVDCTLSCKKGKGYLCNNDDECCSGICEYDAQLNYFACYSF